VMSAIGGKADQLCSRDNPWATTPNGPGDLVGADDLDSLESRESCRAALAS
jgi:hypothetical protein